MTTAKPIIVVNGQLQEMSPTIQIDPINLGAGTPDGTKFLRDDGTFVTPTVVALPPSIARTFMMMGA
jgi:hypothetical protein